MKNILQRPKFLLVLNYLIRNTKNNNMSFIAKKLNITFNHFSKIINFYEKNNILEKKIKGREITLNLTSKGIYISSSIKDLFNIIEEFEKEKGKNEKN